ncbi:hypothetical protein AALP_AA3G165000 [Arabis alpina]|uniref:Uncharacterized protein n=1 Tax=Arabis alpina TaxID=50452 RepID=A0A087H9M0_ARAAL|nr:hypothetical protein AALP_AA3G165000 [Arabis alpina]
MAAQFRFWGSVVALDVLEWWFFRLISVGFLPWFSDLSSFYGRRCASAVVLACRSRFGVMARSRSGRCLSSIFRSDPTGGSLC